MRDGAGRAALGVKKLTKRTEKKKAAPATVWPATMSKRELADGAPAPEAERPRVDGEEVPVIQDEGMGEFEDPFEDEIESDGEIVEGDDEEGDMDVEGEEAPPPTEAYMPGSAPLEEGQTLVPDQSAYDMLHRMNVTWPCLSFDFLRDHLGSQRQTLPHTAFLVAGTQADTAKNNEILVMKASAMHRTSRDDGTYLRNTGNDALRHLAV